MFNYVTFAFITKNLFAQQSLLNMTMNKIYLDLIIFILQL
jgi:hypothetical protein